MKNNFIKSIVVAFMLLIFGSCQTIPNGATPFKPFDQQKYLGTWYEIARFDYFFERNLNNVTATYSLNTDGTIKVQNRGYNYKEKEWKESIGKAKTAGHEDEAKLKVSFFGPFYAAYNVIALDAEYKYALVVGKSLDYIWLLSREKSMPEDIKREYLQKAKILGYKTDELIWVEHTK